MGISDTVVSEINRLMEEQERNVAWLARRAELPYKRVLAEVKHCTRPLTLETAIAVSAALGAELPDLLPAPSVRAA